MTFLFTSTIKLDCSGRELKVLMTSVDCCRSWDHSHCRSSASPRTWTATWRLGTRVVDRVQVGTQGVELPPLTKENKGRLRIKRTFINRVWSRDVQHYGSRFVGYHSFSLRNELKKVDICPRIPLLCSALGVEALRCTPVVQEGVTK
jgi:hypothetical protein